MKTEQQQYYFQAIRKFRSRAKLKSFSKIKWSKNFFGKLNNARTPNNK